jgi:tetratricopeptide (TPR) repeat protein
MAIINKNQHPSQSISLADLKKKKVLIVDDFASFRITMRKMLELIGLMEIDEAYDGREAVKRLSGKKYDIVLCDYNLGPGRDGQQVLEEARHREYIDHSTVFMMVTAENTMDMLMGALEYQPDDYLMKPFTRETMERKLKDWIVKKENLKYIEIALHKKDYDEVINHCDKLIGSNPKNLAQLLKLKGEALIEKGDYDEAAAFYEQVLTMGTLPWAVFGLGKIRFLTGDYDEAKRIFENIIAHNDKLVAAYDWLARIHEKMGNPQEAQKILQDAIHISPKAILRQKALGDIAYKNKDLVLAEQSFKEAVKQGKHSIFKSPADYTSLAKVLMDKDAPEEGLNILKDAGREFTENPVAALQISIAEATTLKKMNREADAKKALEKVSRLSAKLPGKMSSNIELDLAKALLLAGDEKGGNDIIRRLIQSNHEDQELIADIQTVFKDLNIEDKGQEFIDTARDEVIILNNDGVRLVKEGNLSGAIELFEKAVGNLPDNKIINANAAQAYILYMKENGSQPHLLKRSKECLDHVKNIDPLYKNLKNLQAMYKELAQGT